MANFVLYETLRINSITKMLRINFQGKVHCNVHTSFRINLVTIGKNVGKSRTQSLLSVYKALHFFLSCNVMNYRSLAVHNTFAYVYS